MALVSCPECHKEVSDSALRCPSCAMTAQKTTPFVLWQSHQMGFHPV